MADEKNDSKKPASAMHALELCRNAGTPLPVKEIRFASSNGVEIPGMGTDTRFPRLFAGKRSNVDGEWLLELWPWIRSFRVEFREGKSPPVVAFLPQEWGSWSPQ